MKANLKKTNHIYNNHDSESCLLDQSKDADMEAKTKQNKKKRKQKRKNNSEVDISDSNIHRSEHDMIDIPHEANNTDQKQ